MTEAQYFGTIPTFLSKGTNEILGEIFSGEQFDATIKTREAWLSEIDIMRETLTQYMQEPTSLIFFEYTIPRVGGRMDCGVILKNVLFVIEFKTGSSNEELSSYKKQLMQYVVDLKNFHFESYDIPLIPVLVIESLPDKEFNLHKLGKNGNLYDIVVANKTKLKDIIQNALSMNVDATPIDAMNWIRSPYCPTANIVEAARELYNNHTVEEIKRSDAKGENLIRTSNKLMDLIHQAQSRKEKYLCMITGVPGAGKTLIGLSVATQHKNEEHNNRSVYLSGNHPLVCVLQEALTRDAMARKRKIFDEELAKITDKEDRKAYKKTHGITKNSVKSEIKQFIQMIYLWRAEYLKGIKVVGIGENARIEESEGFYTGEGTPFLPYDHVAIFDEAQRTWNKQEHSRFVREKSRIPDFPEWSEARFLISCMDRHQDWSVIVCLIGNGQDINHGEAGIGDWVESISYFPSWKVYAPEILEKDVDISVIKNLNIDNDLHLAVNLRSIRAENLSNFVDYLLEPNAIEAAKVLRQIDKYPIVMTRHFETAKRWIKDHARESERYGVIASSKAQRLRPLAIDVSHSQEMKVESWFLNDKDDVHSSYFMEDIATEFQVQGLEIDWACVAWDGDLLYDEGQWKHRQFKTNGWQNINKEYLQNYHLNAYRVILTRARRGMIILIPEGDIEDKTRKKEYYDKTYDYFKNIGLKEI